MTWGGMDEIFNPGAVHFREEMDRKRIEARIPGNEGGPDTVDLENGIIRITVARKQDAVDSPQDGPDAPQDSVDSPQDAPAATPQDAAYWPDGPQNRA